MTVFNPATFRTGSSKPHHIECMFQGAIAVGDVLPTVKKHPALKAEGCFLVGYPGKKGCFSVIPLSGGRVDVAFYEYTDPKGLAEVDIVNAVYEEYTVHNGWGFSALWKLIELLGDDNEIDQFISSASSCSSVDDFL